MERRLHRYIIGIAREHGMKALAMGGTSDHIHALLSLSAVMPIARATQLIKGGSSRWVHESFPEMKTFAWQQAYGAFTIGVSQIEATVAYIANQEEHHRKRDFRAELIAFLRKNKIEYDERYVFG
jgi:REP element-mobilizing transposase RayT